MEMFGNKSIRGISKVSAKTFLGVDQSLKFFAGFIFAKQLFAHDFEWNWLEIAWFLIITRV